MVADALEILHPARDREHGLAFRLGAVWVGPCDLTHKTA